MEWRIIIKDSDGKVVEHLTIYSYKIPVIEIYKIKMILEKVIE
jgi:hypothetical protein